MNRALLVSLLAALALSAQWNPPNPVKSVQQQSDGVLMALETGALRVRVCSDSILRVTYSPTSGFAGRPEYVVTKTTWPAAPWKLESSDQEVAAVAGNVRASVDRANSSIVFSDANGRRLLQEGPRSMVPVKVNGEDTYRAETFLPIWGSPEAFYGLGQHQAGVWNYRGESVDLSQENSNVAVPMLLSTNGYGIFWNNTSRTRFNNRFQQAAYISSEVADTIDYYFLYGPGFDKIIAGYRELTGAAPMFGKWAYGFWQCKNRYQSQQELLGVAHRYRDLKIPVDNIVQDWFWWNKKGEHVFNKHYPDPEGMVADLHRNNFHLMISVWPFFDPGSPVYEDMDKRGWLIERTKGRRVPPKRDGRV